MAIDWHSGIKFEISGERRGGNPSFKIPTAACWNVVCIRLKSPQSTGVYACKVLRRIEMASDIQRVKKKKLKKLLKKSSGGGRPKASPPPFFFGLAWSPAAESTRVLSRSAAAGPEAFDWIAWCVRL